MSREAETVEIENVRVLKDTGKALLVRLQTGEQKWVPQSLISADSDVWKEGDEGSLVVPEWFAEREELQ